MVVTPTDNRAIPTVLIPFNIYAQVNGNPILRISDIARNNIIKYFSVTTSSTVTFTYPAGSTYLTLLTLANNNQVATSLSITANSVSASNIATGTLYLSPGNYAVIANVFFPLQTGTSASFTYQTDPFPCPFNQAFADYYSTYAGCTPSSNTIGLPCAIYDFSRFVCVTCIPGFTLINGACLTTITCPPRQYLSLGVCVNVSASCQNFDPSNGNCLSCIQPNYSLIAGQCILIICPTGFTGPNCNQPIPTISNCLTRDPTSLTCVTCQPGYTLTAPTTCTPINCAASGPNFYFSVSAAACRTIPPNCIQFNIPTEICSACANSYTLSSNTCVFVNSVLNCLVYNYPNNICLTCAQGYYLQGGSCLPSFSNPSTIPNCLIYSSTGTCIFCAQGFTLQGTSCTQNPFNPNIPNCLAYSPLNTCVTCQAGFALNLYSQCVASSTTPPTTCPTGQVLSNGVCVNTPQLCLSFNSNNQCIQCNTNLSTLVNGSCRACTGINPNFPCVQCPIGQFINGSGVCQGVSNQCGNFNPITGLCSTCISGSLPTNGICCPFGQNLIGTTCA